MPVIEYEYKVCPVCGIHYAVHKAVMDYKQRGATKQEQRHWYCPNGHQLIFMEYEADRLKRELDNAQQQIHRAEQEAAQAQQELAAAEARERRLKKRINSGVCPCCQRTFSNMAMHMKKQHPDYGKGTMQ